MLAVLVLGRRFLFDRKHNQAFVGIGGAASGTVGIASAADIAFVSFQIATKRLRRIFAQPMTQLVEDGPGGLIGHLEFPFEELRRNTALVAAHEIGGEETTSTRLSASGGRSFLTSPIPDERRPCIGRPEAATSTARPHARHMLNRDNHQASAAPPDSSMHCRSLTKLRHEFQNAGHASSLS